MPISSRAEPDVKEEKKEKKRGKSSPLEKEGKIEDPPAAFFSSYDGVAKKRRGKEKSRIGDARCRRGKEEAITYEDSCPLKLKLPKRNTQDRRVWEKEGRCKMVPTFPHREKRRRVKKYFKKERKIPGRISLRLHLAYSQTRYHTRGKERKRDIRHKSLGKKKKKEGEKIARAIYCY